MSDEKDPNDGEEKPEKGNAKKGGKIRKGLGPGTQRPRKVLRMVKRKSPSCHGMTHANHKEGGNEKPDLKKEKERSDTREKEGGGDRICHHKPSEGY